MGDHAEEFCFFISGCVMQRFGTACDDTRNIVLCEETVASGSITLQNVDARMTCSISPNLLQWAISILSYYLF
jgi:hypothetical protein